VTLPEQASPVKDVEEAGAEDYARDMEIALAEIGSWTLRGIHEALRRLDEGTYGICAQCGGTLSEARLRALPFATLCTACQEEQDREREVPPAGRRPQLLDAVDAS
jgi:DnaK suppressor protein